MDKVARYNPKFTPNPKTGRNDYEYMEARQDGGFVHYADYATLRQQLAAALAERDRAVKNEARWRMLETLVVPQNDAYWYVHPGAGADRMKSPQQLRNAIDAAIAAGGEGVGS